MDKRFLGRSGEASYDVFHYDQMSDETFVETVQDVEGIIEQNKRDFNDAPTTFRRDGVEFHHTARIPEVIANELMRQGILQDPVRLKKWLNDPDNRFMRTKPGHL